jgi:hypothetical protein
LLSNSGISILKSGGLLKTFQHLRILIFLLVLPFNLIWAKQLTQPEIFMRCYAQFVRTRPALADPLLLKVKTGQLKAIDACMQILSEVEVTPPRNISSQVNVDSRPFQVLRTFQALHMSWFPSKDFIRQETETPTTNFYDANEMGYHLTYSLFKNDVKFSDIVTRDKSFRGVRIPPVAPTYLVDPEGPGTYLKIDSRVWQIGDTKEKSVNWKPKLVEFGKLVGIVSMLDQENPIEYTDKQGLRFQTDLSKSLGGGILGTVPFILLNTNLPQDQGSDNGMYMHRSWSKSVFSDLLCRSLPVLREEDVKSFVQEDSHLPFRKSTSCLQCHSTMDPMASVIRNTVDVRAGGVRDDIFSPRVLVTYPQALPSIPSVGGRDRDFYRRPPTGQLYYRTYKGELVNKSLQDVKDLGKALAQSEDLYVCAAKRYFEFLTGIDVQIGDFTEEPFSNIERKFVVYRKFVVEQGLELQKHQSLKKLIQSILSSPFYSQHDYRSPE